MSIMHFFELVGGLAMVMTGLTAMAAVLRREYEAALVGTALILAAFVLIGFSISLAYSGGMR